MGTDRVLRIDEYTVSLNREQLGRYLEQLNQIPPTPIPPPPVPSSVNPIKSNYYGALRAAFWLGFFFATGIFLTIYFIIK